MSVHPIYDVTLRELSLFVFPSSLHNFQRRSNLQVGELFIQGSKFPWHKVSTDASLVVNHGEESFIAVTEANLGVVREERNLARL